MTIQHPRPLLAQVCTAERIPHDDSGLEALIFTAEGDMRNALNNLQSTFAGFGAWEEAEGKGGSRRHTSTVFILPALLPSPHAPWQAS
jgi:DNA polymerase III delta prime subunit